jgi:acyl carrier protein
MTAKVLQDRIRGFLTKRVGETMRRNLNEDYDLLASGILDSLAVLDTVAFIEAEFAVALTDDDLTPDNFRTIGAMVSFVSGKLEGRPAAG